MSNDEWTVGRLLTWTTEFLHANGSDTPRLDAEVLLAESLNCRRIDLYASFNELVVEPVRAIFRDLVRQRSQGKPVAYLVGRREFYSLSFQITPDVLIPRPETEFVAIALLDRLPVDTSSEESNRTVRIADVGTGSGNLAISVARYAPGSMITAIDISREALNLARKNAAEHGVEQRVQLLEGDLLSCVPADSMFDFVMSNPPYVSEQEWEDLDVDVRGFEPREALVAGVDGTEIIARLVPQAASHLKSGGWLITEISPMIECQVIEIVQGNGSFHQVQSIKDLSRQPRVVVGQKS